MVERVAQGGLLVADRRNAEPLTVNYLFDSAVENLRLRNRNYKKPFWIEKGPLWTPGEIKPFHPDRYDPKFPFIPKGEVYTLETNPNQLIENPFDIENLRIMRPEQVRKWHSDLEKLVQDPLNKDKLIVGMLNTGGTVMMHVDPNGDLSPGLSADQLLSQVGQNLDQRFALATMDLPTPIDSSQMEVDYDADLAIAMSYVWKNASQELKMRMGGFLLAHGTDTLGPSGTYTSMMLGPLAPFSFGLFGAQKTTKDKHTDAFANTKMALESLEKLHDEQVVASFVAMGGTEGGAYLAVGTNKKSDNHVLAVESPAHPKLLDVSDFAQSGVTHRFNELHLSIKDKDKQRVYKETGEEFWPIIIRG